MSFKCHSPVSHVTCHSLVVFDAHALAALQLLAVAVPDVVGVGLGLGLAPQGETGANGHLLGSMDALHAGLLTCGGTLNSFTHHRNVTSLKFNKALKQFV